MTLKARQQLHTVKGDIFSQTFSFNKATGKEITLRDEPAANWPGSGGAFGLVNGVVSTNGISSSEWLGWQGKDMEALIDLGTPQSISTISCHLLQMQDSWIYLPASVSFFASTDGVNFVAVGNLSQYTAMDLGMYNAAVNINPVTARYIKIVGKNYGKIPGGQPGAGNPAWLFADEIQVD